MHYDAVLLVSFGGPEQRDDVIPFLENVLRGRNVPRDRMLAVAEHYYHFGGRSPINQQCRDLLDALRKAVPLPFYWGNRNWHPMLADTLSQMAHDGVKRALAIATSAYPSYSGCRQYIENIETARAAIGECAPIVHKLPPFSGHPLFVETNADRAAAALEQLPGARLVFTAHSIPRALAETCLYEEQLRTASGRVAEICGHSDWDLVWQSRSGPPSQPWLEPDVLDHVRALASRSVRRVVLSPIGFLSDHMEVLYDLDVEAAALCRELDIDMVRAGTPGVHPKIVTMISDLIQQRLAASEPLVCPEGCCPPPARRPNS
jgi:protoporphyrin/coproporphyrin ferrochelatase